MPPHSATPRSTPQPQPVAAGLRRLRGLTLVEVLIAIALVLLAVSGAAMLFANPLAGVREFKAEARLDGELRGALDLIVRDLRRAGSRLKGDAAADAAFRLHGGAVQVLGRAGWSDVTDRSVVAVQGFVVTPHTETLSLGDSCPVPCNADAPQCPAATVRSYEVLLSGRSLADPSLQRSLRSTVRVRNDRVSGQCPT